MNPNGSNAITLTHFFNQNGKPVGKIYSLKDGKPFKEKGVSPFASRGEALQFDDAKALATFLGGLAGNSHLCAGIPIGGETSFPVSTKSNPQPGKLSRSKDNFTYSTGPGIGLLDHDRHPQTPERLRFNQQELLEVFAREISVGESLHPTRCGRVCYPSSSSFIETLAGENNTGLCGHHVLLLLADASDWPRALEVIFKCLVIKGYGWVMIGSDGRQHIRSIVDATVASDPSRAIFSGPAVLGKGLRYSAERRVDFHQGELLDTRAEFPDLSPKELEEYDRIVCALLAESANEAAEARGQYLVERKASMVKSGATPEDAEAACSSAAVGRLESQWEVVLADGSTVTVGDILDDPAGFHNKDCRDPAEPDYQDGRSCAKIYTDRGQAFISSWAHGGNGRGGPMVFVLGRPVLDGFDILPDIGQTMSGDSGIPALVDARIPASALRLEDLILASDDAPGVFDDLPHFVDMWIPQDEVTLLAGHGGSGKSYVALNLGVHVALGLPFGPLKTTQARVLFFSGEDGAKVLRQRLARVCSALNIDVKHLEGRLFLLDASDIDPALHREQRISVNGRNQIATETPLVNSLAGLVRTLDAGLIVIDNASDTYDDDEIKRARVRTFVRSLRSRIARPGRAVLLLAHVNKASASGKPNEGTEDYSGSTAWNNSVRSRLSLRPAGTDALTVEHLKANLGAKAAPLRLEWHGGVPLVAGSTSSPEAEASKAVAKAEEDKRRTVEQMALLALIQDFDTRGERVTTSVQGSVNVFKLLTARKGYPKGVEKERLVEHLRDMETDGRIFRRTVTTPDRKKREVFTCRRAGAESAPIPMVKPVSDAGSLGYACADSLL
jgi:hypothetical protein